MYIYIYIYIYVYIYIIHTHTNKYRYLLIGCILREEGRIGLTLFFTCES